MLSPHLSEVLAGMVLVGVGTFFAQACATGFVGQAAQSNRGIASGTYLACYFAGGLVGSAVLGQLFDRFEWPVCVLGVGASLALGCLLTAKLTPSYRAPSTDGVLATPAPPTTAEDPFSYREPV